LRNRPRRVDGATAADENGATDGVEASATLVAALHLRMDGAMAMADD